MKKTAGFRAPQEFIMRPCVVAVLIAVLLSMSACAQSRGKTLLTDAQLEGINAGTGLCSLFGVTAPCVGSFLQVFDPALGSPDNPFTSSVGKGLSPSGKVAIERSFAIGGLGTSQSVSQSNSLTVQQPLVRSSCFTCWNPLDVGRYPGQ